MKNILINIVLILTLTSCGVNTLERDYQYSPKAIIGGIQGSNLTASYTVKLFVTLGSQTGLCSAALIDSNHILTAAHCLYNNHVRVLPSAVTIAFGNIGRIATSITIPQNYDDYAPAPTLYDIAVVAFSGSLPSGFSPVRIVSSNYQTTNASVTVSGFGLTSIGGQTVGTLYEVFLNGVSLEFSTSMLKANNPGSGTCTGDSGGPAALSVGNLRVVTGINEAANCTGVSYFTPVAQYVSWILQNASPTVVDPNPAANLRTLYRLYNRFFHMTSTNPKEGGRSGYYSEGPFIKVLNNFVSGSTALYRCSLSNGAHFDSTSPICEGQRVDGSMGFIMTSPGSGLVRLYRCSKSNGDYMSSTNPVECTNNGYSVDGTLGYGWSL